MMKPAVVCCLLLISLLIGACAKQEDTTRLNAEIEATKKQISESDAELKKYNEGSPLHSLVALRASVYRQTLAMLEQKRVSYLFYIKSSYHVDGIAYQVPQDATEKLPKLEEDLKSAQSDLELARKKARDAGGLMAVMVILEAETKALTVAQLEYQLSAYRNGYPAYISQKDAIQLPEIEAVKTTAKKEAQPEPQVRDVVPSKEQIETEMLKSSIAVKLLAKRLIAKNYKESRYNDRIQFEFQYENKTEKEIRAFTGVTVFMDVFERPFLRINLTVDDRIPPGKKTVDKDRGIDLNEFRSEHNQLASKEIENIRFRFEPRSILFSDGTQLGSADGK